MLATKIRAFDDAPQHESADEPIKLNFMLAGVQKGGTSSLYQMMAGHPEIGMSSKKEPHFFDDEERDWSTVDYGELHKLFKPGRKIYGEATPITLYWTAAHKRIRKYNRQMRIILIFRDPIERAYSHWCMQYANRRDSFLFHTAIRKEFEVNRKRDRRARSYVDRGFYGAQLQAMQRVFPKKRSFLYLLSEEFRENPKAVQAKIGKFLDVDPALFQPQEYAVRARPKFSYPSVVTDADREWLRGAYAQDLALFASLTKLDIGRWEAVSK